MRRNTKTVADLLFCADMRTEAAVEPIAASRSVRLAGQVSEIGDQLQMRILACALIALGVATSNRRLARGGTRVLLAHELATFTKNFLKDRIDRTRPRSASASEKGKMRLGQKSAKEETSFPSGHSAGATAAAFAFAEEYPEHRIAALTGAVAVAAVQVPRRAHYLTDVAAGMIIGALMAGASNWLFDRVTHEKNRDCD
jgi:membrane-associated phospholipid phosphatase